MGKFVMAFVLAMPIAASVFAETNLCTAVVADTVAELRAGGGYAWTDEVEGLVRTSAGSACVKALSGRYGGGNGNALTEERSGADGSSVVTPTTDQPLDFKPMSGSPAKKPFERRRSGDGS